MKRTISKKIIIALLSAFVAASMGFAVLLSRPAVQAKADETTETEKNYNITRFNDGQVFQITTKTEYLRDLDLSLLPSEYNGGEIFGFVTYAGFWKLPVQSLAFPVCDCYVVYKADVILTIKDGETEKGTITVPYDTYLATVDVSALGDVSKEGYVFVGIKQPDSETYLMNNTGRVGGGLFSPIAELAYVEEGTTFSVKYYNNEKQAIGEKTVAAGTLLKDIDISDINAEKQGYTFKGWGNYVLSEIYPSNYRIGADMSLYAVYEKLPTYTLTFKDGEDVLGTVEATEGDKLSALDLSSISTAKEGYTFKGWSYTENGELIDFEAETVTEAKTLYAVYAKNTEPTEPEQPDNPAQPDKPSDSSNTNEAKKVIGITFGVLLIALAVAIAFRVKRYRKK